MSNDYLPLGRSAGAWCLPDLLLLSAPGVVASVHSPHIHFALPVLISQRDARFITRRTTRTIERSREPPGTRDGYVSRVEYANESTIWRREMKLATSSDGDRSSKFLLAALMAVSTNCRNDRLRSRFDLLSTLFQKLEKDKERAEVGVNLHVEINLCFRTPSTRWTTNVAKKKYDLEILRIIM